MNNKIGIAIITCNREKFFQQAFSAIPNVDEIVVINDGVEYSEYSYKGKKAEIIQNKKNKGIAKSKNIALKTLLSKGCDHLFLSEDDVKIADESIIEDYINAVSNSKIFHFNYGYHGPWNKDKLSNKPIFRKQLNMGTSSLVFHQTLTGAFSYYHKKVIEDVGLMDELYLNVLEHVDHTYRVIKKSYHPPFKWFADVESSYYKICELDSELHESVIRRSKLFNLKVMIFERYFKLKFGYLPGDVPDSSEETFMSFWK